MLAKGGKLVGLAKKVHKGTKVAKGDREWEVGWWGSIQGFKTTDAAQFKKLSAGEIKVLKDAGYDIHALKGPKNASAFDLYKDSKGEIVVKLKGGQSGGELLGINIKELLNQISDGRKN
ncbi:MAG: polymorphic toxin type 33 domain-containing protein [Bacteroidota bacterium]